MFIKCRPNAIQLFDTELCSLEQYPLKYDCLPHPTVTENIKTTSEGQGNLPAGRIFYYTSFQNPFPAKFVALFVAFIVYSLIDFASMHVNIFNFTPKSKHCTIKSLSNCNKHINGCTENLHSFISALCETMSH